MQVTLLINPTVSCHYFLPGPWLPSQLWRVTAVSRYQFLLLGEQRYNAYRSLHAWQRNSRGTCELEMANPTIEPPRHIWLTSTYIYMRRPTKYTESNMATDFRRWNVGLRKWNSTSTMAHWHVVEPSVAFFLPLDVYAQCQRLYRRCRECCVTVLMAAGWHSGCRRRQLMTPAIKCASTPPTVSLFSITHYVYTCIINRRSCDHPTDISRRRTHRHWIYRLALMSRLTCDFCTNCKCFTFDSH